MLFSVFTVRFYEKLTVQYTGNRARTFVSFVPEFECSSLSQSGKLFLADMITLCSEKSHKVVQENLHEEHTLQQFSVMKAMLGCMSLVVILLATTTRTLGVTVLSRLTGWARNAQYGSPIG